MKNLLTVMIVAVAFLSSSVTTTSSEAVTYQANKCPAKTIPWNKARQNIGRTVTVRGPLRSVTYVKTSKGQPTFLNMGLDYPNPNRFTGIIWGRHRTPAMNKQLIFLTKRRGQAVCLTGRISLYRGVVQIEEITSPSQIRY